MLKIKKEYPPFFHFNFEYQTNSYFAELDWFLILYKLNKLTPLYSITLNAIVMMNTHTHILFQSLCKNENYFVENFLKDLNVNSLNEDALPLCEPILNRTQFLNTYRYIYQNPLVAGLCSRCEDYQFSSLRLLLGKSELQTNIIDPLSLQQNPIQILKWLNNTQSNLFYMRENSLKSCFELTK